MKKNLAAILFAAAALAAPLAWAEGSTADVIDMQALRTAVRTDKKAFVGIDASTDLRRGEEVLTALRYLPAKSRRRQSTAHLDRHQSCFLGQAAV